MYLDIAIFGVIIIVALIGLWKGFFKTIIGFFGTILALVLTFLLADKIAVALLDIDAFQKIVLGDSGSLRALLNNVMPETLKSVSVAPNNIEAIADALQSTFFGPFVNTIVSFVQNLEYTPDTLTLADCVSVLGAQYIFTFLTGVALFIVIRLLLLFLTMFLNSLTKDKTINGINRFLGFTIGAIQGFAIVCVGLVVISTFSGASWMSPVVGQVESSVVTKPLTGFVLELSDKYLNPQDFLDTMLKKAGIITPGSSYEMSEDEAELHQKLSDSKINELDLAGFSTTLTAKCDDPLFVAAEGETLESSLEAVLEDMESILTKTNSLQSIIIKAKHRLSQRPLAEDTNFETLGAEADMLLAEATLLKDLISDYTANLNTYLTERIAGATSASTQAEFGALENSATQLTEKLNIVLLGLDGLAEMGESF